MDGAASSWAPVESGVPQGTVLGPLLFLIFINDLPAHVTSQVRLFADDCLLYRTIKSEADQKTLQQDLKQLGLWASTWGMRFNPSKCVIMTIARVERKRLHKLYTMDGVVRAHTSIRDRGNPAFFHKFPPENLNPACQARTIFFIIIIHNFAQ